MLVVISTVGLAYVSAELEILGEGQDSEIIDLTPESAPLFSNATFNQTLADNTYLRLDASNDPVTDRLTVNGGNGQIVGSASAGTIIAQTGGGGQAGSISFGNTADVGISRDGVIGDYDYNGAFIFKQKTSNPTEIGEFIFIEESGDWRFALPKSQADLGGYSPRSFIIAGASKNNATNFECSGWGFTNIDCDTGGTGADLGVQDDAEILGTLFSGIVRSSNITATNNLTSSGSAFIKNSLTVLGDTEVRNEFSGSRQTICGWTEGRTQTDRYIDYGDTGSVTGNLNIKVPRNASIRSVMGVGALQGASFGGTAFLIARAETADRLNASQTYTTSLITYEFNSEAERYAYNITANQTLSLYIDFANTMGTSTTISGCVELQYD